MYNIRTNRKEIKYYINHIDYLNLASIISNIFPRDKHSEKNGGYHIRSLYFDNISNDGYYDKINGIENKTKYRIRIYNFCLDPVKLEIKSKLNNLVFKETFNIKKQDIKNILYGNYECLLHYNLPMANKIYARFSRDHYRPVILIDYLREAYNYEYNDLRVNFDREIKKNEIDINDITSQSIEMNPISNNSSIILEIKYNGSLPTWIKNIFQLPRFKRCAISKYSLSRYIEG